MARFDQRMKKERHVFESLINEFEFKQVSDAAWDDWPDLKEPVFLVRAENKEQKAFWLKVTTVPGNDDGQKIIRLDDVTQEMLTFQSMCQFEYFVTHKLKESLTGLLTALDTLEIRREDFTDQVSELVDDARKSAERLNKSVDGVFEHVSALRKDAGGATVTAGKLDNFANQLALTYDIKELTVDVDPSVHMRELKLSSEELVQILQELYDNCIKNHPEHKPTISVRVYPKDAETVTIEVTDDGVNVEEDQLSRIGTPFYHAGEGPGRGVMSFGLPMIASMLATRGGGFNVSNRESGSGFVVSDRV